jgi:hypothetical protein
LRITRLTSAGARRFIAAPAVRWVGVGAVLWLLLCGIGAAAQEKPTLDEARGRIEELRE